MNLPLSRDERRALSDLAEAVVTALSILFVGLLLAEFALELSPAQSRWVSLAGWVIWLVFALDFVLRLAVAESKARFLRSNWLTLIAVLLPAFRVFRIARAVRVVRSLRLARLVTGANRVARALGRVGSFAGAGYVVLLSLIVWLLAAAGVSWMERGRAESGITSFTEGLWWAATTIITLGSQNHPVSGEGRILAGMVMVFGLAIQGYITAALAAWLLGNRTRAAGGQPAAPAAGDPAEHRIVSRTRAPHRRAHPRVRRRRDPARTGRGQG